MGTRDRILDAAVAMVQVEGVSGLSVRAVAARAGVGATTLRHHFPTQADLHRAVAERVVPALLDDLDIADATRAPAARLFACLLQFLPSSLEQVPDLRTWFELYRTSMDPGDGGPSVVTDARQQSRAIISRWCAVLADQGHAAVGDVPDLAVRLLAVVDGINLALLLDPATVDLDSGRDMLRRFVDAALARPTTA